MSNNPYLHLPIDMKEELCVDLLRELGVDNIKHNPRKHELTHPCLVSDYHQDQEKNPTASLNYDKLVFKCLGCQASGSLLWFIAVARGESSKGARKWVESKSGGGEEKDLNFLLKFFDALYSQKVEKEPIPKYDSRITTKWWKDLHKASGYLEMRGIQFDSAQGFGLGYDEEKNALIIPHHWQGDLVGWQSRKLEWQGVGPKYNNTPRFPKGDTLYNYTADSVNTFVDHPIHDTVSDPWISALVMEAPLSVVRHPNPKLGLESTATFGASVSKEQIGLLQKYSEVVLWFDNDEAGWKATEKVGKALLGMPVWVINSPFQGDPGEYSREVVEELVENYKVPFAIWNRPAALLCYQCNELEHEGKCDGI